MAQQTTSKYGLSIKSIIKDSNFTNPISKSDVQETLKVTQDIIDKFGPRLTGTEATQQAAKEIHGLLTKYCDSAKIETFKVHRESFMAFMKVFAISYVISSIFFFLGGIGIIVATIGFTFGSIFALLQFVMYKETFDPLFKSFTGYNVIGKISPSHKIKQRIIVQGHHDSAYVMNFLSNPKLQKLYAPRIFSGLSIFIGTNILLIFWIIFKIFQQQDPAFSRVIPYILIIGAPAVLQFFLFKSNKVSPGAGDNLISSMIGITIAKKFGEMKKSGHPLLNSTELVFISSDAEESGLRGARAYVNSHLNELKSIPTFVFNIESIYHVADLSFMTTDLNNSIKLSSKMAQDGIEIAETLGYRLKKGPITWGGGGTDAAEYSRHNIETTCLLGMENTAIRDGLVYHTLNDTVDSIEPAAVKAVLEIVHRYILYKEFKAFRN